MADMPIGGDTLVNSPVHDRAKPGRKKTTEQRITIRLTAEQQQALREFDLERSPTDV